MTQYPFIPPADSTNHSACTHIGCHQDAKYCSDHGGGINAQNPRGVIGDLVDDTPTGQILVCFECLVYWPDGSDGWEHCPACGEPALEEAVKEASK